MPIFLPSFPVLLQSLVRNPFVIPSVPIPITVSVVYSPAWIYIIIENWNSVIISPTMVIIQGTIPMASPWTPPPATPEEQVYLYTRNNVNIVCIGHHDHIRRCVKRKRRRWGGFNKIIHY
jgi:hypothetical protein